MKIISFNTASGDLIEIKETEKQRRARHNEILHQIEKSSGSVILLQEITIEFAEKLRKHFGNTHWISTKYMGPSGRDDTKQLMTLVARNDDTYNYYNPESFGDWGQSLYEQMAGKTVPFRCLPILVHRQNVAPPYDYTKFIVANVHGSGEFPATTYAILETLFWCILEIETQNGPIDGVCLGGDFYLSSDEIKGYFWNILQQTFPLPILNDYYTYYHYLIFHTKEQKEKTSIHCFVEKWYNVSYIPNCHESHDQPDTILISSGMDMTQTGVETKNNAFLREYKGNYIKTYPYVYRKSDIQPKVKKDLQPLADSRGMPVIPWPSDHALIYANVEFQKND